MDKPKLDTCPWCGNPEVKILNDEVCYFVWCNNDDCTREVINCFATEEEAITDWKKECEANNAR